MIVEENNIITIAYELRDGGPDGELLERMNANYPFKFFFGSGKLLPDFEEKLHGLTTKDGFEFILRPEEAYGPHEKGNVVEVPREAFQNLGTNVLIKNNFVNLTDDQGDSHNGKIIDFDEEKVTVDFNHAMAGKTLHFKGAILSIRPATVDELIRKHYIEEDGVRRRDFGEQY